MHLAHNLYFNNNEFTKITYLLFDGIPQLKTPIICDKYGTQMVMNTYAILMHKGKLPEQLVNMFNAL